MTTINLHQQQHQQEPQEKLSFRAANGGFFFSLGILIFTLLGLAGLKVAMSTIGKQNEVLAGNIQRETESLSGLSDLQRIVDVQKRLGYIKSNLEISGGAVSRVQMTQVLDHLGAAIDTGIVIASFKLENADTVSLTFNANNFSDASRQIVSLKNSDYFTGVSLTKISRGEKSVACDITMKIKQ